MEIFNPNDLAEVAIRDEDPECAVEAAKALGRWLDAVCDELDEQDRPELIREILGETVDI